MDILLGLDIGTTNCKALAIDLDGRVIASESAPTPVLARKGELDGPQMYDAEQLWAVIAGLVQRIINNLGRTSRCAGVAVASMGEAGVLVDSSGKPLAPILTWHDQRTLPWVKWWSDRISAADLYTITGLPPDHIYSALKIQWIKAHQPEAFANASRWLCISDWITYCLTGKQAVSYSIASRTMLFDLRGRSWSKELLNLGGIPESLLPDLVPSGMLVGNVTREAARLTGLAAGTPVLAGGHDHICAALAAGAIVPGIVLDSAGTAEAMLVTLERPITGAEIAASGLCCGCHTARDRYYLLGGFLGGGVIDWITRLFYGTNTPEAILQLAEEAASVPPGAGGVWFQPYLDGSGPPERDAEAWGAWVGLKLVHGRAALVRAAMEGLCYAYRKLLENLDFHAGLNSTGLRTVGGGTRNTVMQALKANILGLSIDIPAVTEVTAQGAALLAGIGVGVFADEADAALRSYRSATRYEVDPLLSAWYDQKYKEVFPHLYSSLHQFQILNEVPQRRFYSSS